MLTHKVRSPFCNVKASLVTAQPVENHRTHRLDKGDCVAWSIEDRDRPHDRLASFHLDICFGLELPFIVATSVFRRNKDNPVQGTVSFLFLWFSFYRVGLSSPSVIGLFLRNDRLPPPGCIASITTVFHASAQPLLTFTSVVGPDVALVRDPSA